MNAKDKAIELQKRMKDCLFSDGLYDAKCCALVAVDEILSLNVESYDEHPNPHNYFSIRYWKEVKTELVKL